MAKVKNTKDLVKFAKEVQRLQRTLNGKTIKIRVVAVDERPSLLPTLSQVRDYTTEAIRKHHTTIGLPENIDRAQTSEELVKSFHASILGKKQTLRKNAIIAFNRGDFRNLQSLEAFLERMK